jgi:ferredoxin
MLSGLKGLFKGEEKSPTTKSNGAELLQVTADATRCVQCGICGHNCPVGIAVREYARRGENVTDCNCIACGVCIEKCPRGTLKWGPAILLRADNTLEVNPQALPNSLHLLPRDPL